MSKLSQNINAAVVTIPCGVPTRWNSYINCAHKVYQARSKIDDYLYSASCDGDIVASLQPRLNHLTQGAYRVVHDSIVLLQPLCHVTIDEEA